jgi:hypothetical protein
MAQREVIDGFEPFGRDLIRLSSKALALGLRSSKSRPDAFNNPAPLELGDRAEDVHWSFPAGVVASMPSPSEMNATPSACTSSRRVIRCLRLRPMRSSFQATTTSNLRRRASFTSRSSAARESFAPLTPWSTYSTAVQPRAAL